MSTFAEKLARIGASVMPTAEELHTVALAQYNRVSHTFIDQWPSSLLPLSFSTKLVPVDPALMRQLYDEPFNESAHLELAALLDGAMGWSQWFVRLNSRSPKDMTHPGLPVTCSGKQAVWWMGGSMRCMDDTSMFFHARAPMFICLREWRHLDARGEFRCFAKGGLLLGVSRYFYDQTAGEIGAPEDALWDAAQAFYDKHLADHFPDIVFDLYAPGSPQELLIEINPYGLSDPCCFGSYDELEARPGVRLEGVATTPSSVGEGSERSEEADQAQTQPKPPPQEGGSQA